MNEPASSTSSDRLEAAVAEFLEGLDRGENPNRAALLGSYADVAAELAEFFADHDRMGGLVRPNATTDMRLQQTEVLTPGMPRSSDVTWRSTSAADALLLGQIGQYQIVEEIGRGGMGVVYKARHRSLGREVALKTILSGPFASVDDRLRFQAEAIAAAKLTHKGIVPIFEVGDAGGQPFFAMPLVEGQSLAARLRTGPLPPHIAARLLQKIASAVAYAHANGVIHRDLKPSNILLAAEGGKSPDSTNDLEACEPKISDFGLAKCLSETEDITVTGQIVGTPSYMPPEQASGRRHEVGPAADIYGLGAILYAMLTGEAPFHSDNPLEVILQVIEREPPLPSSLRPGVPRELEWICLKCLEKKPADRYASAADLAADLDRFLRHEPPLARQPTVGHRLQRWIRRKPVLAAHVIGLATALLVTQLVFAIRADRDLAYHVPPTAMFLLWIGASFVCQWLDQRQRTSPWPLYVWSGVDALLLTATLCFINSPLGVFVSGYLVLIAISGTAGRTRLVAFTTGMCMLAYLLLLLLRPDEARPLHYPVFAQIAMVLCGVAVGYQIWRMNVLREYYGERP